MGTTTSTAFDSYSKTFSKKLLDEIKPLKKGKVAVYKLINHGEKDQYRWFKGKNGKKGEYMPKRPRRLILPKTCTIVDPYEEGFNREKILKRITGQNVVRGEDNEPKTVERLEPMEFGESGVITITAENMADYVYMELHPNNKSNPHRPSSAPVFFERTDKSEEEVEKTYEVEMQKSKAIVMLGELTSAESYVLYSKIYPNQNLSDITEADMKKRFLNMAKQKPKEFIKAANTVKGNAEGSAEVLLDAAIKKGVLVFDNEQRIWHFGDDDKKQSIFAPVTEDENPKEALSNWFNKKTKASQKFKEALENKMSKVGD